MEKHRREAPGFLSETHMTSLTPVRLSICIPVCNFGLFVGQTLDSGLAPWLTRNTYRYAPLVAYRIFLLFYRVALRLYRLAMVRN